LPHRNGDLADIGLFVDGACKCSLQVALTLIFLIFYIFFIFFI
jgi:hypothetical protein